MDASDLIKALQNILQEGAVHIWGMSDKSLGIAVIGLLLLALPSRAEEVRVPVPAACRALAERAGLPLTLTHAEAEAARAIAYIRVMSAKTRRSRAAAWRSVAIEWKPLILSTGSG